mgnify:CR=1 FL=1
MAEQAYAYVGVAPCGCIRCVTVDVPAYAKTVRRDVASFMRSGYTIERMAVERVRVRLCLDKHSKKAGCPHLGACPHRANEPEEHQRLNGFPP